MSRLNWIETSSIFVILHFRTPPSLHLQWLRPPNISRVCLIATEVTVLWLNSYILDLLWIAIHIMKIFLSRPISVPFRDSSLHFRDKSKAAKVDEEALVNRRKSWKEAYVWRKRQSSGNCWKDSTEFYCQVCIFFIKIYSIQCISCQPFPRIHWILKQ